MAIDNKLRSRTNQTDIILSILQRLHDHIEELNDQNCFLCDQAIPAALPGGRFAVTVAIRDSQLPHEYFGGAGYDTVTDDAGVTITPIIVSRIDRPYRFLQRILGRKTEDRVPGLVYFKQLILKALLAPDWEPNKSVAPDVEAPLLRDMMSVQSIEDPLEVMVGESTATCMKMHFSTPFDWDLS